MNITPSTFIESQIPNKFFEQYPEYVTFLKKYYEFLEYSILTVKSDLDKIRIGDTIYGSLSGSIATVKVVADDKLYIEYQTETEFYYNEIAISDRYGYFIDIDKTFENVYSFAQKVPKNSSYDQTAHIFKKYFKDTFVSSWPYEIFSKIDPNILTKRIKDYYAHRGTENSFYFFFRIFFEEDVLIYYPKIDIVKASGGDYKQYNLIQLNISGEYPKFYESKIICERTRSSAIVDELIVTDKSGYKKVFLNLKYINGSFEVGDQIDAYDYVTGEFKASANIIQSVVDIDVNTGGLNHKVGDRFRFDGVYSSGTGYVKDLKRDVIGSVDVVDPGVSYKVGDLISFDYGVTRGHDAIARVSGINKIEILSTLLSEDVGAIAEVEIVQSGKDFLSVPDVSITSSANTTGWFVYNCIVSANTSLPELEVDDTIEILGQTSYVLSKRSYPDGFGEDPDSILLLENGVDVIETESYTHYQLLFPNTLVEFQNNIISQSIDFTIQDYVDVDVDNLETLVALYFDESIDINFDSNTYNLQAITSVDDLGTEAVIEIPFLGYGVGELVVTDYGLTGNDGTGLYWLDQAKSPNNDIESTLNEIINLYKDEFGRFSEFLVKKDVQNEWELTDEEIDSIDFELKPYEIAEEIRTIKGLGNFYCDAQLSFERGAQLKPFGIYKNDDGMASSFKKLQDNYYYQDFSYELRTNLSYDQLAPFLFDELNPAGFLPFVMNKFEEDIKTRLLTFELPEIEISSFGYDRITTLEQVEIESMSIEEMFYNAKLEPIIQVDNVSDAQIETIESPEIEAFYFGYNILEYFFEDVVKIDLFNEAEMRGEKFEFGTLITQTGSQILMLTEDSVTPVMTLILSEDSANWHTDPIHRYDGPIWKKFEKQIGRIRSQSELFLNLRSVDDDGIDEPLDLKYSWFESLLYSLQNVTHINNELKGNFVEPEIELDKIIGDRWSVASLDDKLAPYYPLIVDDFEKFVENYNEYIETVRAFPIMESLKNISILDSPITSNTYTGKITEELVDITYQYIDEYRELEVVENIDETIKVGTITDFETQSRIDSEISIDKLLDTDRIIESNGDASNNFSVSTEDIPLVMYMSREEELSEFLDATWIAPFELMTIDGMIYKKIMFRGSTPGYSSRNLRHRYVWKETFLSNTANANTFMTAFDSANSIYDTSVTSNNVVEYFDVNVLGLVFDSANSLYYSHSDATNQTAFLF